jgi:hypothetical protein
MDMYPDYPDFDSNYDAPFAELAVFTNEGDAASTRYGLDARQTIGATTKSDRSFKTAQKWLDSCTHGHPETIPSYPRNFRTFFGEPKFESRNGPSRLIDVFANRRDAWSTENGTQRPLDRDSSNTTDDGYPTGWKQTSKIVDGVKIRDPYTTLSYCWGSHPYEGYITTNANLPARESNLMEDQLPKTFQHVILIARRLGVRYLWIDAVCIIQDSNEDWLNESSKMGSIFSNALLTLVAAAGADSEMGMFNESSTYGGRITAPEISMDIRRRFALRTTLPGGTVRSTLYMVHYLVSSAIYHRSHRRDGPLMSRAWCLQEDPLSPRKLYYSNDQIYWHCDHLSISEDGLIDPRKSSIGFDRHPFLDTIEESEIAWHASDAWYGALIWLDYSRRHVTEIADRLIAISGLASHVATVVKSRYLAGLWELSVLTGLLWHPSVRMKHKTYCAPSWSWASQHGEVRWSFNTQNSRKPISGCEYLRTNIQFLSGDVYGGVSSAALTLRSRVIEISVEAYVDDGSSQNRRPQDIYASYQEVRGRVHLYEDMDHLGTRLFAIPLVHGIPFSMETLLVARDLESGLHRRVGIWRVGLRDGLPGRGTEDEDSLRRMEQVLTTIPVKEITIV